MANFNNVVLAGTADLPVLNDDATGHFTLIIRQPNKPVVFIQCELVDARRMKAADIDGLPVLVHGELTGAAEDVVHDCIATVAVKQWEII